MEEPANPTPRVPEQTSPDNQASYLCQACLSALTMHELEVGRTYPHHSSLGSFLDACQMRCYVCLPLLLGTPMHHQKILQMLAEGKMPEPTDEDCSSETLPSTRNIRDEIERDWGDTRGETYISLTGLLIHTNEDLREIGICLNPAYDGVLPEGIKLYEAAPSTWSDVSGRFPCIDGPVIITAKEMSELGLAITRLPSNTGSHETWSVVEKWIQQCSTQHRCLASANGWYPTRLVEWLPGDRFRVVRSDSGSFCRGKRYITLSHKWGAGNFLRLCTNNLSDLEKGLPIKRLRKTFQDALTVAQRLDIPYVWIDSLCIIQSGDDHEDWRHESQTMTEVYSNSFCNISADYGDEENGLFYRRQNNDFEPPRKIQVRWKERTKKDSLEATELSSGAQKSPSESITSYLVRPTQWREYLAGSPLNRRGWVMQERLLAPRVLSFTPRLVSWNCGHTETTEIWPRRVFGTPFLKEIEWYLREGDQSRSFSQRGFQFHSQGHWGVEDAGKLVGWWSRLVHDYTGCELTKESDRLVAIAGVARKLRPTVRTQYVAGIWAESLPWALSWYAYSHTTRQPVAEYFSPTFSWAACPSQVMMVLGDLPLSREDMPPLLAADFIKYRNNRLSPTASAVQRSDVELLTDDVFGPLRFPTVEVQARGILRSCRTASRETEVGLDFIAYPSTSIEACWTRLQEPENRWGIESKMDHEINPDDSVRTVFYYTATFLEQRYDGSGIFKAEGLLLELVDATLGRFKRVGHISQRYKEGDKPDLLRPLGNERHLPAWSFDEATGEHTFYIV